MIKVKKVSVVFNKGTALENRVLKKVDLSIADGEFITVIGGNGAGKSTLLNALCGDIKINSGSILIDNKDVSKLDTWQRADLVARVFQDPMAGTCASLSIEENLALAKKRGSFRGLGQSITKHDREEFRSLLSRLKLGLEKRLEDPIGLLSGGQRQAVSLLMATLQPMKILALDEHTAALDPKTANFIIDLTQEIIAERKLTALMVTHSMHQALHVGHRTIMMDAGNIIVDVHGKERESMTPHHLLNLFEQKHKGDKIIDDSIVLN